MMIDNSFWSKTHISNIHSYEGTPCLEWVAYVQYNGYGRFGINGKIYYAHRLSYEDAKGKIPEGLELDHLCRNRKCVNPDHLDLVTHKENMRRGLGGFVSGLKKRLKTHCKQGHEFNHENTYTTPDGLRQCRSCHRIRECQSRQHKKMEKLQCL